MVEEPEGVVMVKSCPVPVRLTVCVLPMALLLLSLIVSVPVRGPPASGVKVTLIVHDPPAAILAGQLFVCAKFPLVVTLATASARLPVFESVRACEPLVALTCCAMKLSVAGDTPASGAVPVPVKPTVCVLPVMVLLLSVSVNVLVRVPFVVGAKVMLMVQVLVGARLPLQLFVWLKSPPAVMPVIVSVAVPVLVSVTACEALVVPTF